VALVCAGFVVRQVMADHDGARRVERNFYGTLQSYDTDDAPQDRMRILRHGSVLHGEQFVAMERRREPTAYYGPGSGVGRALALLPSGRPARVGLVGLGAGTLAVYGRAGDSYRLYEIDPQVFELARSEFSFLGDAAARGVRFEDVPGDARLSMEREPPQQFDLLAVDAFSGGAVPVHLITTEGLQVYMRHVKPDGVLAFHLTNRFLQLPPVVLANAQALGLHAVLVHDDAEQSDTLRRTDWVLVSRVAALLQRPTIAEAAVSPPSIPGLRPWTDDFNNLLQILK
jgi:hypothetical protein